MRGTIVPLLGRRLREAVESLEALFYRLPAGFDHRICLAIKGFPAPKDAAKIAHGLAIVRHGAAIALGKHASHVLFGFGTEPDGEAFAEESIIGTGIGNDAAAGGKHEPGMVGENGFESFALHAAEAAGTVKVEDDREGEAGTALNLFVEFDERKA
jgi:hypothetical protein